MVNLWGSLRDRPQLLTLMSALGRKAKPGRQRPGAVILLPSEFSDMFNRMRDHDYFYDYSDSPDVRIKGAEEERQIQSELKSLSEKHPDHTKEFYTYTTDFLLENKFNSDDTTAEYLLKSGFAPGLYLEGGSMYTSLSDSITGDKEKTGRQANIEGLKAGVKGLDAETNPYKPDTEHYNEWSAGHTSGVVSGEGLIPSDALNDMAGDLRTLKVTMCGLETAESNRAASSPHHTRKLEAEYMKLDINGVDIVLMKKFDSEYKNGIDIPQSRYVSHEVYLDGEKSLELDKKEFNNLYNHATDLEIGESLVIRNPSDKFIDSINDSRYINEILGNERHCFKNKDLSGQDFRKNKEMSDTNFFGSDLSGADFRGVNLQGSSFVNAKLNGAKFDRSRLFHAELSTVDLSKVDLSEAKLDRHIEREIDRQDLGR